jgi:tellurite resistance protein TehA-like permease
VAAWVLWALTMLGILLIAWLDYLSRQAGRPELAQLTPSAFVGPVLAAVSGATVGAAPTAHSSRR